MSTHRFLPLTQHSAQTCPRATPAKPPSLATTARVGPGTASGVQPSGTFILSACLPPKCEAAGREQMKSNVHVSHVNLSLAADSYPGSGTK